MIPQLGTIQWLSVVDGMRYQHLPGALEICLHLQPHCLLLHSSVMALQPYHCFFFFFFYNWTLAVSSPWTSLLALHRAGSFQSFRYQLKDHILRKVLSILIWVVSYSDHDLLLHCTCHIFLMCVGAFEWTLLLECEFHNSRTLINLDHHHLLDLPHSGKYHVLSRYWWCSRMAWS